MLGDALLKAFDLQDGGVRSGLTLDLRDVAAVGQMLGDVVRCLRTVEFVARADIDRACDTSVVRVDDRHAGVTHLLHGGGEVRRRFRRNDVGVEFLADHRLRDSELLGRVGFRVRRLDGDFDPEILSPGFDAALDALPVLVAEALQDHADLDAGLRRDWPE